jgi:hypothetical protein
MSIFLYNDSELQMDSQLILCIEEHDKIKDKSSIDTRLFIGWNTPTNDYFIRGKRLDTRTSNYVPYAFHCECVHDLYNFIEFTTGKKGYKSITLYNYNNMDNLSVDSELTYEFFENNMESNYEIAGYDGVKIKKSEVMSYLRLLKKTYNWETNN